MTRHSITAIISKVQILSYHNERYTSKPIDAQTANIDYNFFRRNDLRILKAAVNEIIRLHAEENPLPEIDMKAESVKFLDNIKVICEDYNEQLETEKP